MGRVSKMLSRHSPLPACGWVSRVSGATTSGQAMVEVSSRKGRFAANHRPLGAWQPAIPWYSLCLQVEARTKTEVGEPINGEILISHLPGSREQAHACRHNHPSGTLIVRVSRHGISHCSEGEWRCSG